jgi:hypothetical protein
MESSDTYASTASTNLTLANASTGKGQAEKADNQFKAAQIYALLAIASAANRLADTLERMNKGIG